MHLARDVTRGGLRSAVAVDLDRRAIGDIVLTAGYPGNQNERRRIGDRHARGKIRSTDDVPARKPRHNEVFDINLGRWGCHRKFALVFARIAIGWMCLPHPNSIFLASQLPFDTRSRAPSSPLISVVCHASL